MWISAQNFRRHESSGEPIEDRGTDAANLPPPPDLDIYLIKLFDILTLLLFVSLMDSLLCSYLVVVIRTAHKTRTLYDKAPGYREVLFVSRNNR